MRARIDMVLRLNLYDISTSSGPVTDTTKANNATSMPARDTLLRNVQPPVEERNTAEFERVGPERPHAGDRHSRSAL